MGPASQQAATRSCKYSTLVKQSKALGLVGAVGEEVENHVVAGYVDQLPRRAAPVEARHHPVRVAV